MDWLKRYLADGTLRWRLGFGALLTALAVMQALVGPLAQSQALSAGSIGLASFAIALLLDPLLTRLSAEGRTIARLAREAAITLAAGWTTLAVVYACFVHPMPAPEAMASIAIMGAALNGSIFGLIARTEEDEVLRRARQRARNDLVGNAALLLAAGVVILMSSAAADLLGAGVTVALLLTNSVPQLAAAWRETRTLLRRRSERETSA